MNMKKRITIIGIIVCLLLAFIACKTENDSNAVSEVDSSEAGVMLEEITEMESVLEEVEEDNISSFEPKVIYEQDGLTITAKTYYLDVEEFLNEYMNNQWVLEKLDLQGLPHDYLVEQPPFGPIVELEVVNKTNIDCTITLDNVVVDGISKTCDRGALYPNHVSAGETGVVYVDCGQYTYYVDEVTDVMDMSVSFLVFINDISYYTDIFTFDATTQIYNDAVELNYNNIIFENEDVILYLVSAIVEEGYDEEDLYDDYVELVFLAESKINEFTPEEVDALYFGIKEDLNDILFDSRAFLVERPEVKIYYGYNSEKSILTMNIYNVSWSEIQNKDVYSIGYEEVEEWLGRDGDNNILPEEYNYNTIETGYIDIPISLFTFKERE